jgi:hypothetical protein
MPCEARRRSEEVAPDEIENTRQRARTTIDFHVITSYSMSALNGGDVEESIELFLASPADAAYWSSALCRTAFAAKSRNEDRLRLFK